MHAVIIADNSFATRERAILGRLEVGLADEGVRVIHAVPAALPHAQSIAIGLQSTVVRYEDSGLPFTLRRRATDLAHAIEAVSDDLSSIDAVHAFGLGSWSVAMELARQTGARPLLELWRPALVAPASALPAAGYIVSEPSIAAALRKRSPRATIHPAPWGVHAPDHPRVPGGPDRPRAVAMLCDTGDPRCTTPALAGLADAPDLLIFACIEDASHAREAALWAAARKLNLLDRFSIVPGMESHREPILRMDMLLLPEAGGRQRTLTLEAMAAGVPVVARADPFLETLDDGRTARLVRADTPEAWAGTIASIIANPSGASDLIKSAHEHVRRNRAASSHVADVLRAYQQAAGTPVAAG
jgi:hypothetical protein